MYIRYNNSAKKFMPDISKPIWTFEKSRLCVLLNSYNYNLLALPFFLLKYIKSSTPILIIKY